MTFNIGKLQITIQTIKPDKIPTTALLPKRKKQHVLSERELDIDEVIRYWNNAYCNKKGDVLSQLSKIKQFTT
jgi:hypothetical protein